MCQGISHVYLPSLLPTRSGERGSRRGYEAVYFGGHLSPVTLNLVSSLFIFIPSGFCREPVPFPHSPDVGRWQNHPFPLPPVPPSSFLVVVMYSRDARLVRSTLNFLLFILFFFLLLFLFSPAFFLSSFFFMAAADHHSPNPGQPPAPLLVRFLFSLLFCPPYPFLAGFRPGSSSIFFPPRSAFQPPPRIRHFCTGQTPPFRFSPPTPPPSFQRVFEYLCVTFH